MIDDEMRAKMSSSFEMKHCQHAFRNKKKILENDDEQKKMKKKIC